MLKKFCILIKIAASCSLMLTLPSLACQFAGKVSGLDRKSSARSVRVGPDRAHQKRQGAWEVFMARKMQRSQSRPGQLKEAQDWYMRYMSAHNGDKACERENRDYAGQTSVVRAPMGRPMLALAFLLLLVQPCSAQDCESRCFHMKIHINNNFRYNDGDIHPWYANLQKSAIKVSNGVLTFPDPPLLDCPHWTHHSHIEYLNGQFFEGQAFLETFGHLYEQYGSMVASYNQRKQDEYDAAEAAALKVQLCIAAQQDLKTKEAAGKFEVIRQEAERIHKLDGGAEITIPATVVMDCPAEDDSSPEAYNRAEAEYKKYVAFLEEINSKIEEIDNRRQATEGKEKVHLCIAAQQDIKDKEDAGKFEAIRQMAERISKLDSGAEITIPAMVAIDCPAEDDSSPEAYTRAEAEYKKYIAFLEEINSKIEEINKRGQAQAEVQAPTRREEL